MAANLSHAFRIETILISYRQAACTSAITHSSVRSPMDICVCHYEHQEKGISAKIGDIFPTYLATCAKYEKTSRIPDPK